MSYIITGATLLSYNHQNIFLGDVARLNSLKNYTVEGFFLQSKNQIGVSGNLALESALKVATESDSPRAFEVVAILLKTMADLNNNVIDVHKKVKDTTNQKVEVKQTNNSVFVGSTKELQNLINKERSTEKDVVEGEIVNESKQQ